MTNQLTVEQIAPYLPYNVSVVTTKNHVTHLKGIVGDGLYLGAFKPPVDLCDVKLILRPLEDLKGSIEVDGFTIQYPITQLGLRAEDLTIDNNYPHYLGDVFFAEYDPNPRINYNHFESFDIIQKLISWHFDVFGLIKEGLAVDINTVEPINQPGFNVKIAGL